MPPQVAEFPWPQKGIDISRSFSDQLPGSTPAGDNVRTYEPLTDRDRGGSRPGLTQYITQQLPLAFVSGSRLIQELNTVVSVDYTGLQVGSVPADPDPFDGTTPIDDPSSPGPPGSWGHRPIVDSGGNPTTPAGDGSRNPGGPSSTNPLIPPQKRRRHGDAFPPNKNVLQPFVIQPQPRRLFDGLYVIRISGGAFDGQTPSFASNAHCIVYNPPTSGAPTTALAFPEVGTQLDAFLANAQPYTSYVVVRDEVNGPGAPCTP